MKIRYKNKVLKLVTHFVILATKFYFLKHFLLYSTYLLNSHNLFYSSTDNNDFRACLSFTGETYFTKAIYFFKNRMKTVFGLTIFAVRTLYHDTLSSMPVCVWLLLEDACQVASLSRLHTVINGLRPVIMYTMQSVLGLMVLYFDLIWIFESVENNGSWCFMYYWLPLFNGFQATAHD